MSRSSRRPSRPARADADADDRPRSRRHTGHSPRRGPTPYAYLDISYEACFTPLTARHRASWRSGTTRRSPPR